MVRRTATLTRPVIGAAFALCVVFNVIEFGRNGSDADRWGLFADLSELILPLLSAWLFTVRARSAPGAGWGLFAYGALSWMAGQLAWIIIRFGLDVDPTVSVASIGFVGWAVLTAIGLLRVGGVARGWTAVRPMLAEAMVLSVAIAFLLWELALAGDIRSQSTFKVLMLAIVPISTCFVVAIALLLSIHDRSPVIGLVGVAGLVLIVGDSLLTVWFSDDAPLYAIAHVLYLVTFVALVAAAVSPHRTSPAAEASGLRRIALVYTPLVAALWVATIHYLVQHRDGNIVSVLLAFAIGVLVAFGHLSAWFESASLARQLNSNIDRLKGARAELRDLLDNLPEAVVVLTPDGRISETNALTATMLGRPTSQLIGFQILEAVAVPDRPTVEAAWARLLKNHRVTKPVFTLCHVDGSEVVVEADVRLPTFDPDRIIVTLRDVTERLREATELEAAQTRFRLAFRSAPNGMAMVATDDLTFLDVNDTFAQMLGYDPSDLIGVGVQAVSHPEDWRATWDGFATAMTHVGSSSRHDRRFVRADGQVVWAHTTVSTMIDHNGQQIALAHVQDVTEQRRAADHLRWAASHDELTGLPNRAHFLEQLRRRLEGAEVGSIAVLFIDLDNFKVINDSLGHAVGDELLRGMSERLRSVVRDRDMLGRFGGDEFIVMLDGLHMDTSPAEIADRLREAISEPLVVDGAELYVTGSIGMAFAERVGVTADELLRDADAAMYRAKARGRDRVERFAPGSHENSVLALRTSSELRHGLERGEIVPYFQPIVDLASGQLTGFEVLARWRHPDRGLLGPDQFLPMAEETGLIGDVGAAVLNASLAQLGRWHENIPSLADVSISVNVSVRQLVDPRFLDVVADSLAHSGVRADSLWLEITESALMSDVKTASVALRNLRNLGLHLSVDDFGTGYSSLTYLKRFPVEAIKVDRTFVKGLGIDVEDTTIVEAVINLGKSLGLMVVAEGVETPLQLTRLRDVGCDRAQGYLFGRPRPAALIEAERSGSSLV